MEQYGSFPFPFFEKLFRPLLFFPCHLHFFLSLHTKLSFIQLEREEVKRKAMRRYDAVRNVAFYISVKKLQNEVVGKYRTKCCIVHSDVVQVQLIEN